MIITICNKQFDTEKIQSLSITSTNVLIDTDEEFYNLRYTHNESIEEAERFLKFQKLQKKDLLESVMMLIMVCEYFINTKTQCSNCPLKRKEGCIFYSIPIDWRS